MSFPTKILKAKMPAPDYDSGWTAISAGWTTFTHNLGTANLLVHVQWYREEPWSPSTYDNAEPFAGWGPEPAYKDALFWRGITENDIQVGNWWGNIYCRVRLWKLE